MGNLGTLLIHDKEFSEARRWYEKGALGGDASAMNGLAWLYEQGLGGLHQDFTEARRRYETPARLGNSFARRNLFELDEWLADHTRQALFENSARASPTLITLEQ
jgi:TPR repeat protein